MASKLAEAFAPDYQSSGPEWLRLIGAVANRMRGGGLAPDATTVAGFLPGAGFVQGNHDAGKARRSFSEGNYGQAAIDMGNSMLNTASEAPGIGMFGKLAMAGAPAAKGIKTFWSDFAKTKHPIAVEDMTATRVPTGELLPRQSLSPEALQGSILTPAVGDRTIAGARLTHVNDKPLSFDVSLEGGPDFMRSAANQHDGAIWASDKGVITRLAKHARDLGETGKDVNFVYSSMGARSGDYSHMMSDALLAQLAGSKIPKKGLKAFDEAMKQNMANWPGINNPALREELLKSGPMRKAFVEEMALGTHQGQGFPEIGSTRNAISEPALLGQPTGVSGYAVAQLDPSGRVIADPRVPHSTYNTQLGGVGYLGGFDAPIPRDKMFPTFFKDRRAAGAPPLADDRAFSMSNVSQNADQEWLDGIMEYLKTNER